MATTTAPELHEALRAARGELSIAEMARRLGVKWETYKHWERGAQVPDDDNAEQLAVILDEELPEVVWMLYRARIRAKGALIGITAPAESAVLVAA